MINYSIGGRMLKRIQIYLLVIFLAFSACTTKKKIVEDEFATEEQATDSLALDAGSDDSMSDDLSLDESGSSSDQAIQAAESSAATDANTDELSLESELQAASDESKNLSPQANSSDDLSIDTKPAPTDSPVDEMSSAEPIAPSEVAKTEVAPPEPVPVQVEATTTPVAEQPSTPAPLVSESPTSPAPDVQPTVQMAQVSEVQFKSNDSGGALIIQADRPLEYTTRLNTTNNQVIIEVLNVKVPSKLKRPLATKDMSSSIGHIDIYQKEKASTARFVIQLRPNSDQPLIQPEGSSLMVIGALVPGAVLAQKDESKMNGKAEEVAVNSTDSDLSAKAEPDMSSGVNSDVNTDLSNENLLNTTDMDEYLANNTKFYGKKISIETTDMDVRDVLKFIAEESGVNMLFDDNINGTISLKLRKVPWDQAFVLVLKSKGLSYRRQGSVLRVASADRLVAEEKSAILLKESKTAVEPL
jgi:type IV pilus assembly protein PilQ